MVNRDSLLDIDIDTLERETGFGLGRFTVLGTTLVVLGALAFIGLPPAGDTSVAAPWACSC